MMLVQTTVVAVIPFFERFMARFPDVAALAAADEAEVIKAWEGLGYYRRARQLHQAAKRIVSEHAGVIPADSAALRACRESAATSPVRSSRLRSISQSRSSRQTVSASWRACWRCARISSSRRPPSGSGRPPRGWCRLKMRVPSIRRSWIWGRWSARRESLAAWSARSSSLCRARQLGLAGSPAHEDPQASAAACHRGGGRPGAQRPDPDPGARVRAVSGSDSGNSRLSISKGSIQPAD